ncbi:unnamed protein product [Allacma fusca]|uniref:Uncharacterized protein n=1 Tax=Allacma fusca TaxID=39272 RepID=A0A8J2LM74_9HEXA|nr:unnamed protein product [Allacma fusca]
MKPKNVLEAQHEFANYAKKQNVFQQQNKVVSVIGGPITNAREKLRCIDSVEAEKLLREVGYAHSMDDIKNSILEVFEEEVEKAQNLLREAQSSINYLKNLLDDIGNRITAGTTDDPNCISHGISDGYEDCRTVWIHFQLRNKILKHYLLAPADLNLNPDPFSQVPDFKSQEDRIVFLLCKIEAIKS